ncbi:MAG: CinA family protein [Candidatus Nanopelagicales bacterium]|nr:CinA family protein [Candidatus Nanopelagicales bacterium]
MTGDERDRCRDAVTAIHQGLRDRGWSLAVGESLTAGLVAAHLADVPGASDVLRGGVVAYATDLKESLLGVPRILLDRTGPVSAEVARAMAEGVANLLGADVGLAVTGAAGPTTQGTGEVGEVFGAFVAPGAADVARFRLSGDRNEVRDGAVVAVLGMLVRELAD